MELSLVDLTDLKKLVAALKPTTRMVWFESPSNPLLKVVDIRAVADAVKRFNPEIIVVVDNTFMSPFFQKPLSLGADAVMHSVTKYINGHSDVIMGAVVTNDDSLDQHLYFMQLGESTLVTHFTF